ncbi:MAG: hypothetical protein HKN04_02210, partial [Rhodothermaceae bacterium]|nr:hypothetical protein [Rhodothermaceae bacterium]
AWPHDAAATGKDGGEPLAYQYRKLGLKMMPKHASSPDGGNSLAASVMEMLELMKEGRFKVFNTCSMWLEEFRIYHRKDGKIVERKDDLLDASRYAMMMRRHARVETNRRMVDAQPPGSYDPLSVLN